MINIKRFIDKVTALDNKKSKDFVIPLSEAKVLRDELSKLLVDYNELLSKKSNSESVVKIEFKGGSFK